MWLLRPRSSHHVDQEQRSPWTCHGRDGSMSMCRVTGSTLCPMRCTQKRNSFQYSPVAATVGKQKTSLSQRSTCFLNNLSHSLIPSSHCARGDIIPQIPPGPLRSPQVPQVPRHCQLLFEALSAFSTTLHNSQARQVCYVRWGSDKALQ